MADLNDLFPDTSAYKIGGPPDSADGGRYNNEALSGLWNGRGIFIIFDYRETEFYAQVYVVQSVIAKPSARVPSPKKRQLTRTAWASVAPLDDYVNIADAVHDVAVKLHENYTQRYKANLDAPLEDIITATLQSIGVLPPGEA